MKKRLTIGTLSLLALGSGLYWLGHRLACVPRTGPPAAVAPPLAAVAPGQPAKLPPGSPSAPPPEQRPPRESPEVAAILGHAGTFQGSRLQATHRLARPLPAEELAALLAFLREPTFPPGSTAAGERAVRNDLLNALETQAAFPPALFATLREVYRDPGQDLVLRDYAIQHLVQVAARQTNITAPEAHLNRQALWAAAGETGSSIAGTALLGLHRLATQDPAIDASQLAARARAVAEDPSASELARVSAIQVCAARNQTATLPTLRELAAREQGSIPVRISAVGALGQLGGEQELAFLAAAQPTAAPYLQPAILAACRTLTQRTSSNPVAPAKP